MKTVEQSHCILQPSPNLFAEECKLIEWVGRVCYKSEDKIGEDSWKLFIMNLIDRGHEAMIEFGHMTVRFITDRGISHEIVRHRLCSFAQESTRYCNYSKDKFNNEVTFIQPGGFPEDTTHGLDWYKGCKKAEELYFDLLKHGGSPQQARAVLPNCTKTEIVVKANFREWRHIFKLRAISKAAHPDMRRLMIPLYEEVRQLCPEVFNMGDVDAM